jgi:lipid-A-disaccharide synthase
VALVTSGTVTLQVARQRKPMVTFYRFSRLMYHLLGRWLVSTPYFTLPNLIAGKRIVPELIPYFDKDGEEVAMAAVRLLRAPGAMDEQRAQLAEVCRKLEGRRAARAAAEAIEGVMAGVGR